MAIRTVVTRGYGNGTFNGTIPLVVTKGYGIANFVAPTLAIATSTDTAVYTITSTTTAVYNATASDSAVTDID